MAAITRKDMFESLRGDVCPVCGGTKKPMQTLCPKDYRRCSRFTQRNLYERFGEGYEAAVADAFRELGSDTFLMKPTTAAKE